MSAIATKGEARGRWLGDEPPQLGEVRSAVESMISDGVRASEVVWSLRSLSKKAVPQRTRLNLNDIINGVIVLVHRELLSDRVSLQLDLEPGLPQVLGDRVQLQQVIMHLLMNAIQAMAAMTDRPRELSVRSHRHEGEQVLVEVHDTGVGITPENMKQLFNA